MSKIKLLIVDDSALIRDLLKSFFSSDPGIEVVGTANDPFHAREMIKALNPDVITLDVEMPKMDGLSFLEKIMRLRPMPVVMVSSLTQKNADITIRALEIGAVDFVAKPTIDMQKGMQQKRHELIEKVKAAAKVRVKASAESKPTAPKPVSTGPGYISTEKIVAIGASTGGVEALRKVISGLPPDCPATLITQHMPAGFTKNFADRMDKISPISVVEAEDGARILPGHIYVAKGDHQMEVVRSGGKYHCRVYEGEPVSGHCPSVDVLFASMAKYVGVNGIGIILTGMGRDGAEGLKTMRDVGAATIGQDRDTSLVYGMPRVAHEAGGVAKQLPIDAISAEIIKICQKTAV